jgi:hypothetical protein
MPDFPIHRRSLSRKLRFEVFKRDEFRCQYCGRHPPEVLLEVDHVIAVAEGGDDSEGNLVTSCADCNRGKGARSLKAVPISFAARTTEIEEREQQLAAYSEALRARADRVEKEAWQVARVLFADCIDAEGTIEIATSHFVSIKRFVSRLPLIELIEAAEIAWHSGIHHHHPRFLYFCKICWTKIKGESS